MMAGSLDNALERIESALLRIERAALRVDRANDDLVTRHARLRAVVGETLRDIDGLITEIDQSAEIAPIAEIEG